MERVKLNLGIYRESLADAAGYEKAGRASSAQSSLAGGGNFTEPLVRYVAQNRG